MYKYRMYEQYLKQLLATQPINECETDPCFGKLFLIVILFLQLGSANFTHVRTAISTSRTNFIGSVCRRLFKNVVLVAFD
jgi:hypothetical protein